VVVVVVVVVVDVCVCETYLSYHIVITNKKSMSNCNWQMQLVLL